MRTQEEILAKIKEVEPNDFFGTRTSDLLELLDWEHVQPFLKEGVKEEQWVLQTVETTKTRLIEYLTFAYDKARNQRGLSAGRSMEHYHIWIWYTDPEFYETIKDELTSYWDYGIPQLDKIAEHYAPEQEF